MAVIEGGISNALQEVNNGFKAARSAIYPQEVFAWNSICAPTGLLTGVAANGAIFSLKNNGANPVGISRVGIGFLCTVAFTTAQRMEFALRVMRNITVTASGGTQLNITANNTKHRTNLNTPTQLDCRIATTAALAGGTNTADTNYMAINGFWVGGIGTIVPFAPNNLFTHDAGDYPIVLAQNESIVIDNLQAMGATGVGVAYVAVEFCEFVAGTF
jgi:hypothetical protein